MSTVRLWNGEELRVGKIIGLGRNYAKHAREMGAQVPGAPLFFLKPATSIVHDGGKIVIPPQSGNVAHEVELGFVVARTSRDVPESLWRASVLGYCVVLDMTARDIQAEAQKKGEPWSLSKGFDTFCPVSRVVDAGRVADPQALELELRVNGQVRQRASTGEMVYGVAKAISYLSSVMTLERGDLVATGTPEGVGAVRAGDRVDAEIRGLVSLSVSVVGPRT